MDSESDMEVVYNYITCTCICIHNTHNIHSSKTNILFHSLYYTDTNNTPHYRCTHTYTHQPLVSICDLNDLKLSWQPYETNSSQGISHAMVEFRNCLLLSIIAAWCDERVQWWMGINTVCGHNHSTHQLLMKEAETVSEMLDTHSPSQAECSRLH